MGGVLRGDLGLPENGEVCFEGSYHIFRLLFKDELDSLRTKKATSGKGKASGSYFVFINFGFVGL